MSELTDEIRAAETRFRASFVEGNPDQCWYWLGSRFKGGYGRFNVARTALSASRAMYIILHGDVSSDLEVCHTCDNRACVNPAHLWLGTPKENAADKMAKGRHVAFKGELNPIAKLTESEVRIIRSSATPHRTIAREFGIDEARVRQIRKGDGWNHV